MSAPRRVLHEPAWLLHHRPWSDAGRILEFVTRGHGRVTLFARGVRRPESRLRGLLQPFLPLLVSWSGRADGGTLTGAEIAGTWTALPPDRLMSGFYLNELLLRLLPREERHDRVFDGYRGARHAGGRKARGRCGLSSCCCSRSWLWLALTHEAQRRHSIPISTIISTRVGPARGPGRSAGCDGAAGADSCSRWRPVRSAMSDACAGAARRVLRAALVIARWTRPAQPRSDAGTESAGRERLSAIATTLGVNIDHVATLRQARGGRSPDPLLAAAGRTGGRRQHHAAPARGPPPHPGPRRRGIPWRPADPHESRTGRDGTDAGYRGADPGGGRLPGSRAARGTDHRGRARGREPASRDCRRLRPARGGGHPRGAVYRSRAGAGRGRASCGSARRRAAHGRLRRPGTPCERARAAPWPRCCRGLRTDRHAGHVPLPQRAAGRRHTRDRRTEHRSRDRRARVFPARQRRSRR